MERIPNQLINLLIKRQKEGIPFVVVSDEREVKPLEGGMGIFLSKDEIKWTYEEFNNLSKEYRFNAIGELDKDKKIDWAVVLEPYWFVKCLVKGGLECRHIKLQYGDEFNIVQYNSNIYCVDEQYLIFESNMDDAIEEYMKKVLGYDDMEFEECEIENTFVNFLVGLEELE